MDPGIGEIARAVGTYRYVMAGGLSRRDLPIEAYEPPAMSVDETRRLPADEGRAGVACIYGVSCLLPSNARRSSCCLRQP